VTNSSFRGGERFPTVLSRRKKKEVGGSGTYWGRKEDAPFLKRGVTSQMRGGKVREDM